MQSKYNNKKKDYNLKYLLKFNKNEEITGWLDDGH